LADLAAEFRRISSLLRAEFRPATEPTLPDTADFDEAAALRAAEAAALEGVGRLLRAEGQRHATERENRSPTRNVSLTSSVRRKKQLSLNSDASGKISRPTIQKPSCKSPERP